MHKDYVMNYLRILENKTTKLLVSMQTEEYGELQSRTINAVQDEDINRRLLDSLADELIDKYELALGKRSKPVAVS